jgi:hypothetical protein
VPQAGCTLPETAQTAAGTHCVVQVPRRRSMIELVSAELAAEPVSESGYRYFPTGEFFSAAWGFMSSAERKDFLRTHEVRMEFTRLNGGAAQRHLILDNLHSILSAIDPNA